MVLHSILTASLLLFPLLATVHSFVNGRRAAPVGVVDRGELILDRDKFSHKNWNSSQLVGKVRVIQRIAGRPSAKEKDTNLTETIKAASSPHDRYQIAAIANTGDAIPGIGMFVCSSIESNKKLFPWLQFIIDSSGPVRKTWQLSERSSAIVVLDKDGRVKWVKDDALTQQEVQQVIDLLHKLLNKQKPGSRG